MILYVIVFLASLLCAFMADVCQRQIVRERMLHASNLKTTLFRLESGRNVFVVLSAGVLVLLSGLRYDTGFDYHYSYVPSLETVREGNKSHYDPLFNWIISLFAKLDNNQWFFFGMALVTIVLVYVAFYLNSSYILLPLAYFLMSFHYLRSFCFVAQYVAMAVSCVAFILLLKKRWKLSFVLIALASMLHLSALALVPFFLCYFLRNRWLLILSLVIPIVSLFFQGVVRAIIVTLSAGSRFAYYISGYFDTRYVDKSLVAVNVVFLMVYLVVYYLNQTELLKSKRATMFLLAQSICFSFTVLQTVIPVGYRFVWYYMIFQCFSIPYFVGKATKGSLYYIVNIVLLAAFFLWMLYGPIANGSSQILPYHPVFSPETTIY